ncbi:MAG: hypothetical protein AB9919_11170 [Geobacteraceae bacterium]
MARIHTHEELVAIFDRGMLASEMARRFGLKDKAQIQQVEALCAELHNTGKIDLLGLVETDAFQGPNASDFFMAMHFFCRILPELDATPARMMACIHVLVTLGGEDLAAHQPNSAFRAWCAKDQRRSHVVIAAARSGDELASHHLTFALEAINAVSEARQIALAYDDGRRLSAITALGRIEDDNSDSRAETFAAFSVLLDSGFDDDLRANMLAATAAILSRAVDSHSSEVSLVSRLVEGAGEFTLHQAAHMLWAYSKALQSEIVASLLQALERINPANKGTVNELDLGLQALLKLGYDKAAIDYITELLSRPDDSLELNELDSFTRTLVAGSQERLSRIVVKWLLLGKPRLCDGLAKAIRSRDLEGPPLDLCAEDLAISSSAQIFLCRKAIGWFFLKSTTAASVLVSVLRFCDEETALEVKNLLVNILLLNYSGVQNYLEGLAPDDAAKSHINQALAEHEAYHSAIVAIPLIKELQPSEHQRRIEQLRMVDQMRDAQKKADSESVLLSMVKHSVLLYGTRSLSFIKDFEDSLRPFEMDLKPYSISFEIPRMEIVDPVGLDYMLRVFRTERMTP